MESRASSEKGGIRLKVVLSTAVSTVPRTQEGPKEGQDWDRTDD